MSMEVKSDYLFKRQRKILPDINYLVDLALRLRNDPNNKVVYDSGKTKAPGFDPDYQATTEINQGKLTAAILFASRLLPLVRITTEKSTPYSWQGQAVKIQRSHDFTGLRMRAYEYRLSLSTGSFGVHNAMGEFEPIPFRYPHGAAGHLQRLVPGQRLELQQDPGFRIFTPGDCEELIDGLRTLGLNRLGPLEQARGMG